MACKLDPDPDPLSVFDVLTKAGVKTKVFVEGLADTPGGPIPVVGVTRAELVSKDGRKNLDIDADHHITVEFPTKTSYDLNLTLVGPQVRDRVQLSEACDDGTKKPLASHRVGAGPNGPSPLMIFEINAE